MKLFTTLGSALDWAFSEVAGATKKTIRSPEIKRIAGVGVTSAVAGMTPEIVKAALEGDRQVVYAALWTGFLTGLVGGTVSLGHRMFDGYDAAPYAPSAPLVVQPSETSPPPVATEAPKS